MRRRTNSSFHQMCIILAFFVIVGMITGGYVFFNKTEDPYRTVSAIEISSYLENSDSLRGNTYKVTGTILNLLSRSPNGGRLFSLEVKSVTDSKVLPLLIPSGFNPINIQKGQRYYFKIQVDQKGIPTVMDLQKV